MIDYDALFNKEPFRDIDKKKLERLKELHKNVQNKKGVDVLLFLKELNELMSSERALTTAERDKMICAMKDMLSYDEIKKFDACVNIMNMMA